ncbi:hypothetical protein WN944_009332 [Citrus x changshan-huyou]|uniref:Uncharacterized protein n=1 Tax=Citrus x changshan-huyou TaxID=2935761 RepID=A0AAP0MUB9_9ROSI
MGLWALLPHHSRTIKISFSFSQRPVTKQSIRKDNHSGNSIDQQVLAAYGGATCSDQNFEYDDSNNI